MNTCPNCASTYNGNYCNECGQKFNSGRIYFKELVHDFFSNFFTLESPINLTVRTLTINPGSLVRDFIKGKRKIYYRPVQYFILTVAFYLLVRAVLDFNPIENQFKALGKQMPPPQYLNNVMMQASFFMARNINLLLFAFVFIFALFGRIFFRKSGYNYTENLVFGFYSIGHYVLQSTLIIPLTFINPKLYYIVYLILIGFLTFSLMSFHKPKFVTGIIKSILTVIISFGLYVFIVYFSAIYYIILFVK